MKDTVVTWILLEKFCEETGYTPEAVRTKRRRGIWPDGVITSMRSRRLHVNRRAYDRWVEKGVGSLAG